MKPTDTGPPERVAASSRAVAVAERLPVREQDRARPHSHRAVLTVDEHADCLAQQRPLHDAGIVEVERGIPALEVAQYGQLREMAKAFRQPGISGVVVSGPAVQVAEGRAVALDPPDQLKARAVRHGEAARMERTPEREPVGGIEDPVDPARAGLRDVQADRRAGQHRRVRGPGVKGRDGNSARNRRRPSGLPSGLPPRVRPEPARCRRRSARCPATGSSAGCRARHSAVRGADGSHRGSAPAPAP